jgi:hypothetical protein
LYYNKCVRNDHHCPECRKYFISIHKTKEEACNAALKEMSLLEQDDEGKKTEEKYKTILEKGEVIWIDEWVRRSNGDIFQVFKIIPTMEYKTKGDNINVKCKLNNDGEIKYLVLNIYVDKNKDCPNDILFYISFHCDIKSACDYGLEIINENKDNNESNGEKLMLLKPLCFGDKDLYNYIRIVELEYNKEYKLNDFCDKFSEWYS